MRTYLVPLLAGLALAASPFLPWVVVGDETLTGFPDTAALWVVGLGAAAAVLAILSLITRRNSRHPLLLVGLVALGVLTLSWRIMPRAVEGRALTRSQAQAIVRGTPLDPPPPAAVGGGLYLGLASATLITLFGLTIVLRPSSIPYVAQDPNDDV